MGEGRFFVLGANNKYSKLHCVLSVMVIVCMLLSHYLKAFFMANNGQKDRIVISVGGSLIVPKTGIDTDFLTKLNSFIRDQLATYPNRQFFLVVGGGAAARHYRDASVKVLHHELTRDDLDWLGIQATRLNAQLIRTIFQDIAHQTIIRNYDIIRKPVENVVVAAGWKPGWSTDYCAILLCEDYGANTIINMSNVSQVYDKDPSQFADAKPFSQLSWKQFRELVGNEWSPGLHSPFDPVAAQKAEELQAQVVVVGKDFANVERFLY